MQAHATLDKLYDDLQVVVLAEAADFLVDVFEDRQTSRPGRLLDQAFAIVPAAAAGGQPQVGMGARLVSGQGIYRTSIQMPACFAWWLYSTDGTALQVLSATQVRPALASWQLGLLLGVPPRASAAVMGRQCLVLQISI